jgi:hypothetical protein
MLTYATYVIVILTTLWVVIDSSRLKIPSNAKKPYSAGNGPVTWLIVCALLWIVAFPVYLYTRAKALRERGLPPAKGVTLIGLAALAALILCVVGIFLGWQRLTTDELRDQVVENIKQTYGEKPATRGIEVKSLNLIHDQGDDYHGTMVVRRGDQEESHEVKVNYDGKAFRWEVK